MAILIHAPLARRWPVLAALALATLAACALLHPGPRARPFAFSHQRHVAQEKLECANCHADAFASDQPGLPARDTCEVCHTEIDAAKPQQRRIEALFAGADFAALHASRLPAETVFSHQRHVAKKLACNACHAGIESSPDVALLHAPRMQDCVLCHEQLHVAAVAAAPQPARAQSCAPCHREIGPGWAPASHRANWKKAHGGEARAKGEAPAAQCALCHEPASCDACHRVEAPANHNAFWRQRAHGLMAMSDRQSCAACHAPESCEACHRESAPASHHGTWGPTPSTHCLACHQPLRYESCSACHAATASHLSATHKPPDHTPGMNCRQCHGLSAPLPHVDNGDDCNSCHL